jgi:DnaK suppressor protein
MPSKPETRRRQIERLLLAERDDLARRVRQELGASVPPESHSQPSESAVDDVAFDLEFHRRQSVSERLAQVDLALARIRNGGFGLCDECGGEIEPRRVEMDPAIRLCLGCQSASEKPHRARTL